MKEIKFRAWDKIDKKTINWRDTADNDALLGQLIMFPDEEIFILMQYTGLKDKDNKEIYEGDLIQNESGRVCEVKWCEAYGQWDAFVKIIVENDNASGFSPEAWRHSVKIIGNIYENSDLLKECNNASI